VTTYRLALLYMAKLMQVAALITMTRAVTQLACHIV